MSEWKAIDSAPKDASAVLTYMPPLPHQDRGWINIQKWKGLKVGWVTVGDPNRRRAFQPTHWMPLPPPPLDTQESTDR